MPTNCNPHDGFPNSPDPHVHTQTRFTHCSIHITQVHHSMNNIKTVCVRVQHEKHMQVERESCSSGTCHLSSRCHCTCQNCTR